MVILALMKVAVSIPDPIFRAAEKAARRRRVPRSQFYAKALEAFVKQQERSDVTDRLNEVYDRQGNDPDPALLEYGRRILADSEWEE